MAEPVNLDDLFAAARRAAEPSAAFLARIEAEALALQPQRASSPVRPGAWGAILQAIGGWRGAGGLAAAALAGLWIGVSDPGGLLGRSDADGLFEGVAGLTNPFALTGEEV